MKIKIIEAYPVQTGVSKFNGNAYRVQEYKAMEMVDSQAQRAQWFKFSLRNNEIEEYNLQKGDLVTGKIFLNLRRYNNKDGKEFEQNEVVFIDIQKVGSEMPKSAEGANAQMNTAGAGYPNTAMQQNTHQNAQPMTAAMGDVDPLSEEPF